jgi:transcriptional regulator with XRE-family HTH domain
MQTIPGPTPEQVEEYAKALGRRLRELRDERGLQRKWVAEQLGVHYNSLKYWELGISRPGIKHLLHLAVIYQVPPSELTST